MMLKIGDSVFGEEKPGVFVQQVIADINGNSATLRSVMPSNNVSYTTLDWVESSRRQWLKYAGPSPYYDDEHNLVANEVKHLEVGDWDI